MTDHQLLQAISNMLGSRFEEMEGRFSKIDSHFEKMEGGFSKIDSHFEEMEGRFSKIDSHFEEMEGRFSKIDSRFEEVEGRFSKIDSRFEKMEGRFSKIDNCFGEMEDRLNKRLRSTENSILNQLDIVQEKSNDNYHRLEGKLGDLRVIVNGIKIDHDTVNLLSKNVSNLHYEVHKLKSKLS